MGTRTARQIRRDKVFKVASQVGTKKQKESTRNLTQGIGSSDQARRIVQGLLSRDIERDRRG